MKKQMLMVLAVSLIVLAGCKGGGDGGTSTRSFIGGTQALEFNFVEGSPPKEVFDGGNFPFDATLNIQNKGEFTVNKEKINITLKGFFPGDFNNPVVNKNPDENMEKSFIDSEGNIIPGTVTFLTFSNFNFIRKLPANNEFNIRAELCYNYGTTAQGDICILDDLTQQNDLVCVVNEKKSVDSSSSPIQIENFVENVAGTDKVGFNFEVVQRGSGRVAKIDSSCDDEEINKDKVWVDIDTELPGLTCSGITDGNATSGFTKLFGGKRLIRCTQDTSLPEISGKDFEKKVTINARFDYKEHKEIGILVKHATG
ncbi:hypothetical protein HYU13_05440 [Candidatus Woesearchaeota archaeon]|nr:hypothetical protein [Candidatus Woesearchaeota archaeon]